MSAVRKPNQPPEELDVIELTPEEGRTYFDQQARRLVGMSGEEFLRQLDAGTYQPTIGPDGEDRNYNSLIMCLPFAGRPLF
jgi:hypothetical protein